MRSTLAVLGVAFLVVAAVTLVALAGRGEMPGPVWLVVGGEVVVGLAILAQAVLSRR